MMTLTVADTLSQSVTKLEMASPISAPAVLKERWKEREDERERQEG